MGCIWGLQEGESGSEYVSKKTYNVEIKLKDASKYSAHLMQHLFWYRPGIVLCSLNLGPKSSLCELQLLQIEGLDQILIDAK